MFFKNWAAPNKEYRKFIAFNNTGGRCWARMDATQREAALCLWRQEPSQPERFDPIILDFWNRIHSTMATTGSPQEVRMQALSDNIRIEVKQKDKRAVISCPEAVREYIESHLDDYRQIIQTGLLDVFQLERLNYKVCPP